jgi:hypothetical protein
LHVDINIWKELKKILNAYGIKSLMYKHINPRTKKHTKGLRLEFSTINTMRSFELFINIMEFFKKNNITFSFSKAFDKAVGSRKVKDVILGNIPKDIFFKEINRNIEQFQERMQKLLFYKPYPSI